MPDYSTKLRTLVNEYADMQIEFPELKDVTLAQWILESGRGSSDLAELHNNFGGLKWRSEMAGFATPVHYVAHDGPDTYCAFTSERAFVTGYWKFIDRPPYKGWRDQAGSDESFIQFIGKIYAPAAPSYAEQVLNLRAEARNLLGQAPGEVDPIDDSHGTSEPHPKPSIKEFIQSPNRGSRNGVPISRVILHYTAGPSAKSAINTFLNDKGPKRVSSHYIVDKNGDIYQMVADNEMASHCKGANIDSIGIEHVAMNGDPLTPAQEISSIALIKYLLSNYKLKPDVITGHNFAKGRKTVTACPHSLFGKYRENDVAANEAKLKAWVKSHFEGA